MSERLAVSATLSVLMMSIYVLFGTEAARAPFGPQELTVPAAIAAPGSLGNPGRAPYFSN